MEYLCVVNPYLKICFNIKSKLLTKSLNLYIVYESNSEIILTLGFKGASESFETSAC